MSDAAPWIVVGGGPAGLATAACLGRRGIAARILERDEAIGDGWRRHYDRLRLHTPRRLSGLPGLPLPAVHSRPGTPPLPGWHWGSALSPLLPAASWSHT